MYRNRSGRPLTSIMVQMLSMDMVPVSAGSKIALKVRRSSDRASEKAAKVLVNLILNRFSNKFALNASDSIRCCFNLSCF